MNKPVWLWLPGASPCPHPESTNKLFQKGKRSDGRVEEQTSPSGGLTGTRPWKSSAPCRDPLPTGSPSCLEWRNPRFWGRVFHRDLSSVLRCSRKDDLFSRLFVLPKDVITKFHSSFWILLQKFTIYKCVLLMRLSNKCSTE